MYLCSPYLTTYLSQPGRYFLVFSTMQICMLLYFIFTAPKASPSLLILTVFAYIIVTAINIIFPFVDPGILPKILFSY